MIKYTKTSEIAISALHPLDKERVENLVLRLQKRPKLAEDADLYQSSRQTRVLPISTELVLLIELQGGLIYIQDVTTPRRFRAVEKRATAT